MLLVDTWIYDHQKKRIECWGGHPAAGRCTYEHMDAFLEKKWGKGVGVYRPDL